MSNISNEQYQEALEIVAQKEYGLVGDFQEALDEYLDAASQVVTRLDEIRSDLPVNPLGQSAIRAQIESVYSQLRSFRDQGTYLKSSITNIVQQYNNQQNPQPASPAPAPVYPAA